MMTTASDIILYTWNFLKAEMGWKLMLEIEHSALHVGKQTPYHWVASPMFSAHPCMCVYTQDLCMSGNEHLNKLDNHPSMNTYSKAYTVPNKYSNNREGRREEGRRKEEKSKAKK